MANAAETAGSASHEVHGNTRLEKGRLSTVTGFQPSGKSSTLSRSLEEACRTNNWEATLLVAGTLTTAIGLISLILAAADWYFRRHAAGAGDWNVLFYFAGATAAVAMSLFFLYGISRYKRHASFRLRAAHR